MSMLAEKKRKQKWSLNPRGNDWVQDSNKFGQKMLEKMGWQHGKGLGAKENGITEHVKVSYKNDSKGMGYKESSDQWTEHETNFSALLESLSGEKTDEIKLNSLEKKSQSSRARVHYHKFTRGKDLSRYSEKDLANIFGKKTLKEPSKAKVTEEKADENEEKNDGESKFLFNAGSMRDYFKKKLPGFGKSNRFVVGHNGVLKGGESDSEAEMRPSFNNNSNEVEKNSYVGFGFNSEVIIDESNDSAPKLSSGKATFVSYVNGSSDEQSKEKKRKNKRKGEEHEVENVLSPNKKMRKPEDVSKNSASECDKGISNPAFNPLQTPLKVQKHILDTIEETISETVSDSEDDALRSVVTTAQIHKGPQHKENSDIGVVTEFSNGVNVKVNKRSKKLARLENGLVNEIFTESSIIDLTLNGSKENESETSLYEVKRKEVKKKKKGNKVTYENSEQTVQDVIEIEEEDSCELSVKKTKKKKEKRTDENVSVDLTSDESKECDFQNAQDSSQVPQIKENPYEVEIKKSKKKNKESKSYENSPIDLSNDDSGVSSITEETPSKAKPKKKKQQKNFALENPSFDDNLEESIDLTQSEENPYEVKVKKKKHNKCGIDNLNFNESFEESAAIPQNEENPYEIKVTEKKKKRKKEKDNYAIENPNFNESSEEPPCNPVEENPYEVKLKKKKKKKEDLAIDNPIFKANDSIDNKNDDSTSLDTSSSEIKENISLNVEDSDLMLNVVTTPIITKTRPANGEKSYSVTKVIAVKRRKSVRFSDVTQERIIPNNDDLRNLSDIENRNELFEINTQVINKGLEQQDISFDMSALDKISYDDSCTKRKLGLDNAAFDKRKTNLEENVESISKTLDMYEAEIENDINEKKLGTLTMEDVMIGEVGNPHGEHEKLPEGTKLKFKHANFTSKTPLYHLDKTGAKKSYKHLIKGDILVGFKNTNLHEIQGYAVRNKSREV